MPMHTSQVTASNSKQKINRNEVAELIVDAYSDGDFSVAKLTGARKITDI
jgi:hypothetical protein